MKIGEDRTQAIAIGTIVTGVVVPTVFILVQDEIPKYPQIAIAVLAGIVGGTFLLNKWLVQRHRRLRPKVGVAEVADDTPIRLAERQLAVAVEGQWRPEAKLRGLLDSARQMRIGWSLDRVPEGLGTDMAEKLRAWDLEGRSVERLAEFFRQIPTKILVVLGPAESGKSAAAILLTLGLLEDRTENGESSPVPVLFGLASWDPTVDLSTWLKRRLVEDHPWLRATNAYGEDAAGQLLGEGRVLPILDGLDEVPVEHRPAVIAALEKMTLPLKGWALTCRSDEYRDAESAGSEWLRGAVIVSLTRATPDQATSYLRNAERPDRRGRWDPVFTELADNPAGPLASALSSPLMVALAHEVYKDPAGKPVELLGLADRDAIEAHLVEAFVPAVFPPVPAPDRIGGRWRRKDACGWLGHLAAEMERRDQREVCWWELSAYARPATSILAGLVAAATAMLAVGLAVGVLFNPLAGAIVGGAAAIVLGVASAVNKPPKPSEIQVQLTGRLQSILMSGLPIGLIVIAVGTFIRDLSFGFWAGLFFGGPIGILYGLTTPDATARAVDPRFLLRRDLYVGVTYGTAYGIPAAIVGWLVSGNAVIGIALGLACALAGGLLYGPIWMLALQGSKVGMVAFGHLALATLWLAPRRKLPWRVLAFLADAHQLGVLRQAGGVYQFRHIRLQKALAELGGFVEQGDRRSLVGARVAPSQDEVAAGRPAHPPPDPAVGP